MAAARQSSHARWVSTSHASDSPSASVSRSESRAPAGRPASSRMRGAATCDPPTPFAAAQARWRPDRPPCRTVRATRTQPTPEQIALQSGSKPRGSQDSRLVPVHSATPGRAPLGLASGASQCMTPVAGDGAALAPGSCQLTSRRSPPQARSRPSPRSARILGSVPRACEPRSSARPSSTRLGRADQPGPRSRWTSSCASVTSAPAASGSRRMTRSSALALPAMASCHGSSCASMIRIGRPSPESPGAPEERGTSSAGIRSRSRRASSGRRSAEIASDVTTRSSGVSRTIALEHASSLAQQRTAASVPRLRALRGVRPFMEGETPIVERREAAIRRVIAPEDCGGGIVEGYGSASCITAGPPLTLGMLLRVDILRPCPRGSSSTRARVGARAFSRCSPSSSRRSEPPPRTSSRAAGRRCPWARTCWA